MTPQAFSYATLSNNGFIYVPPYGLTKSIDYMLKMDPKTYEITTIKLKVNKSREKWQQGIAYRNKIYFLPYNEENILELLAIDLFKKQNNYEIILLFSNNGIITLYAEIMEVTLEDLKQVND